MFLSIYYFFKNLKPMKTESHHKTLRFLSRHAKPENLPIVEKIMKDLRYIRGKEHVRRTGLMHPPLSRILIQKYIEFEGNQGY